MTAKSDPVRWSSSRSNSSWSNLSSSNLSSSTLSSSNSSSSNPSWLDRDVRTLVVPNWFPDDQLLADADEIPIPAIMATADNTTMTVCSLLVFMNHTDPLDGYGPERRQPTDCWFSALTASGVQVRHRGTPTQRSHRSAQTRARTSVFCPRTT